MTTILRCSELANKYPGQEEYSLGSADSGVSFEVAEGELFALLGPSGCGKTTTLRIIGGFVEPTKGRVEIAGQDVTAKPPHTRPTNTVFQSYALFPHMTVGANVEFGLKMDGVGRSERRTRAAEALETVGMGPMADRRIAELSGGQQQRIALARAMVKRPSVLLLDEPFGALDLRLRRQMQDELVRLKQHTAATFVHVTHDQEEACAIADRVAVMNAGRIAQVDTPVALYRAPRTDFVAEFLNVGTVLRGRSDREGTTVRLETPDVTVYGPTPEWVEPGMTLCAVLPPDRVSLADPTDGVQPDQMYITATVEHVAFTGSAFMLHATLGDNLSRLTAQIPREAVASALEPGSRVTLTWRHADVIIAEDTHSVVTLDTALEPALGEASTAA
jgi:ABC-type Fe3+/spermidine/putrescine transport system ATPase subunit